MNQSITFLHTSLSPGNKQIMIKLEDISAFQERPDGACAIYLKGKESPIPVNITFNNLDKFLQDNLPGYFSKT